MVTIGSLGKTVWGGLRVGWIRAEVDTIRRLVAARTAYDLGTPEFEQAVAEHLFPQMPDILAQRSGLLRGGPRCGGGRTRPAAAGVGRARRARRGVALDRTGGAAQLQSRDECPPPRPASFGRPALLGGRRARTAPAHPVHRFSPHHRTGRGDPRGRLGRRGGRCRRSRAPNRCRPSSDPHVE